MAKTSLSTFKRQLTTTKLQIVNEHSSQLMMDMLETLAYSVINCQFNNL